MPQIPRRPERAKPTPLHQQLIDDVARLRAIAKPLFTKIRKVPQIRPGSPEAEYLRFVAIALDDADFAYGMSQKHGGSIEVAFVDAPGPERLSAYRILHRPPPSKVTDLNEYRLERARRAS